MLWPDAQAAAFFKLFMETAFRFMYVFLFILLLSSCDKSDDSTNTDDPANLTVTILSIDHQTRLVEIQASAQNAVQYHLYIDGSADPEEINESGFFTYTFESDGKYNISVQAYGISGRYIVQSTLVTISSGSGLIDVPLDKGYFSPEEYDGYTLTWQDEFNGSSINNANWNFDIGDGCPDLCGWGNNELEYYRQENAWVGNEYLTIEARDEQFANRNYTSAKLTSKDKVSFKYGRVDIRALLPFGKGMWPALWLLGQNIDQAGWPYCGEIDIMEMIGGNGGENTTYGTIHWHDGEINASYGGSTATSGDNLSEAYHVFSIVWDETKIIWYLDNQQYFEASITDSEQSEFQKEFYLILNVAVGGNWPGNPDATTLFPQQMRIDYVRVFQKN